MENEIKDLLFDINSKCDELLTFKDVHLERHKGLDEKIMDCRETLYANPEGITYKVEQLIQCRKLLKNERAYWRTFWFGVLRTVAAAAIIGVAVWLLSIYKSG